MEAILNIFKNENLLVTIIVALIGVTPVIYASYRAGKKKSSETAVLLYVELIKSLERSYAAEQQANVMLKSAIETELIKRRQVEEELHRCLAELTYIKNSTPDSTQ